MGKRAVGWRQGPDGRWYPPINESREPVGHSQDRLVELAVLVNSGALTAEIDEVADDPDLAV